MVVKTSLLLLLIVCSSFAQLTIKNPKHLAIPEDRVQITFKTACRVVAEEFHVPSSQIQFPLVLVLGENDERYTADENTGTYTIYLRDWNPSQFANSAIRLAVLRLVPRDRRNRMLSAILSRSNAIAPISVEEFKQPGIQREPNTTAHAIPIRQSPQP